MKVDVCDKCMADGKLSVSSWNHRLGDRVVVHLCNEHHMTHVANREADMKLLLDAEDKYREIHNAGLAMARRIKKGIIG